MGKVIGIDLGTTNSCVAFLDNGEAVVIPNELGNRTTPSVVAFSNDGGRTIGDVAKRESSKDPENVVFAVKRLMGESFDSDEIERHRKLVPYKVIQSVNGDAWVSVRGREYSPPEISAFVVTAMKETAESYLGEEVTDAVITVPAYFNDSQRAATKAAGKIAGLNVLQIVNEPTAAALAYKVSDESTETQRIAVYDLGGGTFDISILEIRKGVFTVKSTAGDTHLGGEDIDNLLVEAMASRFQKESGVDVSEDSVALARIREEAEKAKKELSSALQTNINIPFLAQKDGKPVHLEEEIKRSDLEILVGELIERSLAPCKQALSDAKLEIGDIDEVILVGGQTRMPLVQKKVADFFKREPHKGVNPDEVVAMGAALRGGSINGETETVLLMDVTPLSLGVETGGGIFTPIIPRNTTVPTQASEEFTTSIDNQPFVPVHVLQGERNMAEDNKSLARFELAPLPPAPRGVPVIEVTFDIDSNGMVNVTAKDKRSGQEQGIRVVASSGLSEDDIDRIIAEAKEFEASDAKRRELAELKTTAEGLLYTSERAVEEWKELVPAEILENVAKDAASLRSLIEDGGDALLIRDALQQLEVSAYSIADAMYGEEDATAEADDAQEGSNEG